MIKQVHIENFRCFKDVTVGLEPLTILLGPNASGKSSFLEVLDFNSKITNSYGQPEKYVIQTSLVGTPNKWRRSQDAKVKLEYTLQDGSLWPYREGEATFPNTRLPLTQKNIILDVTALRQPNKVKEETVLAPNGINLANFINTLPRKKQSELGAQLAALVPVYSDVDVRPHTNEGFNQILFQDRWDPEIWYKTNEVSDGTMLMLAFLTLQYENPAPDVVAIEEPEHGLHPYLLGKVIEFLREIARGRLGRKPIQFVLATHSPEVLDSVQPQEVRFFNRNEEDGSVYVKKPPVESPEWEQAFEEYERSLAQMWLSGGLGGVPGS